MRPHLRAAQMAVARKWSLAGQSTVRPNLRLRVRLFMPATLFVPDLETETENKTASSCFGLPCGSILRLPLAWLADAASWPMRLGGLWSNHLKIQQLHSPTHSTSRPR